jgi:hypothetical protein
MSETNKAEKALKSTAKTRKDNAEKNAKFTSKDGVSYLKEGVTGAQFNQAKLDTNRNHHRIQSNISQCIKNAQLADVGYFSALRMTKTQMKAKLRPQDLVQYMSDWEITLAFGSLTNEKRGYVKFTVWGVLTCIKRKLEKGDVNPNAVKFFEGLDKGDTMAVAEAFKSAEANVLKKRAEKEAKK